MRRDEVKSFFHIIWSRDINQIFLNITHNFQKSQPFFVKDREQKKDMKKRFDL